MGVIQLAYVSFVKETYKFFKEGEHRLCNEGFCLEIGGTISQKLQEIPHFKPRGVVAKKSYWTKKYFELTINYNYFSLKNKMCYDESCTKKSFKIS